MHGAFHSQNNALYDGTGIRAWISVCNNARRVRPWKSWNGDML